MMLILSFVKARVDERDAWLDSTGPSKIRGRTDARS